MKILVIILMQLLAVALSAQPSDSSRYSALRLKLSEYYDALKHENLDVQQAECDFLIESASDSTLRQFIAQDIYSHYSDSPVMGSENVAVHVFDRWFASGKLQMPSFVSFAEAKAYADFNRQSLIGKKAPELQMEGKDGTLHKIFGKDDSDGTFKVLYFYDTDCSKCSLETHMLDVLLAGKDYPVQIYAVYVGDNRAAWDKYTAEQFRKLSASPASPTSVLHLWDPAFDSDFQRKYGVTQTPRLFLISPDGTILGRGLDVHSLEIMLDSLFLSRNLEYGTKESEMLFDGIFAVSSGKPSVAEVKGIADYIHDRTLAKGDSLMFRQMSGDYLYYLSTRSGEGFKEGLMYHIDKNILSKDVWKSSDDSLKVVGFARIMSDLLSKSVPGTRIPSIKVPGQLYSYPRICNINRRPASAAPVKRNVSRKLDKLPGKENIIIFYTEGCGVCAAEKSAALSLSDPGRRTTVFMINMDELMESEPALASRLMDSFDLSSLPYIVITDLSGTILRRYCSLTGA